MHGVWLIQTADGTEERIEAGILAIEGNALIALSSEGVLTQAWAPGRWQTVRLLSWVEADPGDKANLSDVVVGLSLA